MHEGQGRLAQDLSVQAVRESALALVFSTLTFLLINAVDCALNLIAMLTLTPTQPSYTEEVQKLNEKKATAYKKVRNHNLILTLTLLNTTRTSGTRSGTEGN